MFELTRSFQTINQELNTEDYKRLNSEVLFFDNTRDKLSPQQLRLAAVHDVKPFEIDLFTIPISTDVIEGDFRPWSLDIPFIEEDSEGRRTSKHIEKGSLEEILINRIKRETVINGWVKFINTLLSFRISFSGVIEDLIPFRILAKIIKERNGETFDENERGEILLKGAPPYNSLIAVQSMMCLIACENILSYKLGDISDNMKLRIENLVNEMIIYVLPDPFVRMKDIKECTTLLKTMGFEKSTRGKKIVWAGGLSDYAYADHSFRSEAWSAFYDINEELVREELIHLRTILPLHAKEYEYLLSAEVNRDNLTLFTYLHFPDSLIGFNRVNTSKDAAETLVHGIFSPEKERIPSKDIYDYIYNETKNLIEKDLERSGRSIFPNVYDFNKLVMTELKNTASGSSNLRATGADFNLPPGVKINLRTKAPVIIKNYSKLTYQSYEAATTFKSPGTVGFRVVRGMKKGRGIENVPVEQSVVDSVLKRLMDVMATLPYYTNGKTKGSLATDHANLYMYSSMIMYLKISTDFTRMDTTATTGVVRIPMFQAILDSLSLKSVSGLPLQDYIWNGYPIKDWYILIFEKKRLAYYALKYKPPPDSELYQYYDHERELLILPLAMNYSGEGTTNIINNLLSNAVQKDYLNVILSSFTIYPNQSPLNKVMSFKAREILGDDGMIVFDVSRKLTYNELMTVGEVWDLRTQAIGLISNINKLVISYIKIEYLKKLFILGYHIPRKHQLDIVTREKKFGNLFLIEKFAALLQYMVSMMSRGYPYSMVRRLLVAMWLLDRRMKTETKESFYFDFFALLTPKSLGGVGFCPLSRFSSSTDISIFLLRSDRYLQRLQRTYDYIETIKLKTKNDSVLSKIGENFDGFNKYVLTKMFTPTQVTAAIEYESILIDNHMQDYSLLKYGKRAANQALMSNIKDNNLGKIMANIASKVKVSYIQKPLPKLVSLLRMIKFRFCDEFVVCKRNELLMDIAGLTNDLYTLRTIFGITNKSSTDLNTLNKYSSIIIDSSSPRDIGIETLMKLIAPYVMFGESLDLAIKILIGMGFDPVKSDKFVNTLSRDGSAAILYSNLVNYSFNEPTLNDLDISYKIPFNGIKNFPLDLLNIKFFQYVNHMFIFLFCNQHPVGGKYRKIEILSSQKELESLGQAFRLEAIRESEKVKLIKNVYAMNVAMMAFLG